MSTEVPELDAYDTRILAELQAAARAVEEETLVARTGGAPTLAIGMSQIFATAFATQDRFVYRHEATHYTARRESFFFDYVTDELIKDYGVKTVRSGGLTIKTTIDLALQRKARAATVPCTRVGLVLAIL